ncbi:protein angel homolog 1 isoform X2 [Alosa pseudoharengus]|uniref:protein angel homolog 1 isoform X2 n=1 Tax=Alosa pseudoharengus TaxID=34774 RepID=UPI003F88F0B6
MTIHTAYSALKANFATGKYLGYSRNAVNALLAETLPSFILRRGLHNARGIVLKESLVKAASSVLMNGKETWDTGGPRPQKLAKCQSAVLDEWLGPSGLIHKNSEKTIGDDESKCLEEMQEEIMEKKATPVAIMWRVWEDLPGPQAEAAVPQMIDEDPDTLFKFSVMSYNILAQDLLVANPDLYLHCSDKVLVWSARLKGIIQEIQAWRPDILCLQEAQEDHFKKQLQPVLSDMGYSCVYKRRTGSKTDGCAVCYQNKRFSQLSVSLLELRKERCELLDRDNVAIVLLLQPITSQCHDERGTPICVATTHLLFNPRRGDIKLAQLVLVLAEVDKVVKRCKAMGRDCEVVLCGDFNSLPNMPLYQFISTGQLHYHGLPAWMISGQEDLSHQTHPRRVLAPLLPSSLGINDNCQYVTTSMAKPPPPGELKYNHDYMLNLRYSQAACVRPKDLEHIPGVTDNAPDQHEKQPCALMFRNTICHCLNLNSAYSHIITGTDRPEVTTVHSSAGATVDYIFYTARSEHSRSQTDKGAHGGLELIGRLSLLSEADLWSLRGLPNEIFTSDHLSLLVKFQLRISPL